MWEANGKQVLRDGQHFADAINATAAREIVQAMIAYDQVRYEATQPEYHDAQPALDLPPPGHRLRREADEMVCSCGIRWDASEGDEHP